MTKNNTNKKVIIPDGLSDQVGAMIEHFDDKLSLIAEQVGHVSKKADRIEMVVNHHSEDIEIIKMNIEFIKSGLKKKVDVDDFQALEHRVSLLESRR